MLSRHESHEIFTRLLLLLLHGCGMHRCLLLLVLKQEMRSANATHGLTQRENWVGALNLGVVMVNKLLDHLDRLVFEVFVC